MLVLLFFKSHWIWYSIFLFCIGLFQHFLSLFHKRTGFYCPVFSSYLKVSRSRNKIVEPKTSPKKWINEFVFLSWWLVNTFDFKFQAFPSRQDRKTNLFVCFLGEVTARHFCFEIYWPLVPTCLLAILAKFMPQLGRYSLRFWESFSFNY